MGVPDGISVSVDKNTEIVVTGIDKQLVGQFAADRNVVEDFREDRAIEYLLDLSL